MDASRCLTTNPSRIFRSHLYSDSPNTQTLSWRDIRDRIFILHIHDGINYLI